MFRIGIDLGGTTIKIGLVDSSFRIVSELEEPTNTADTPEAIIHHMADMVKRMLASKNLPESEVEFLGIGSPGGIDYEKGTVLFSNNFNWNHISLVEFLQQELPFPMALANDAQCAMIGEAVAGAAAGQTEVVMLTLGTGVGGGVISDGKVLNYRKGAGILGHNVIHRNGRPCSCGRRGCLEAYASATALVDLAGEHFSNPELTAKMVFDAADAGDEFAKKLEQNYIEDLGEGIANFVDIFRPDLVLIGGGISKRGEALTKPLQAYVHAHSFAGENMHRPVIRPAALGNDAGIIGAAALDRYLDTIRKGE